MKKHYEFNSENYDSIEDVLDDVYRDEYLYEKYLREVLRDFAPFQILNGIRDGDMGLAEEITDAVDDAIFEDINKVEEEDKDGEEDWA